MQDVYCPEAKWTEYVMEEKLTFYAFTRAIFVEKLPWEEVQLMVQLRMARQKPKERKRIGDKS